MVRLQTTLYQNCRFCDDGVLTVYDEHGNPSEEPCWKCGETGRFEKGLLILPSNVFESHVVLEAIDTTEYNALTDAQKGGVTILLSCGKVDLNEGKAGRVRLWNWFGGGSTTVANLTALLED